MSASAPPAQLVALAHAAARAFLGADVELTLLGHGSSLTHRARTADGDYLLRVHVPVSPPAVPGYHTPAALESECQWLHALATETAIGVQAPVPSPAGGYVLHVAAPDASVTAPCTLLRWVPGEPVTGRPDDALAARLGALVAALHTHARGWTPPPGFQRPTQGPAPWHAAVARMEGLVERGVATADDRARVRRAVARCEEVLAPVAADPRRVGLIHGDLHAGNYVEHAGRLHPLDFGAASFAPWLKDLAEVAGHLGPGPRRALVDAYAETFPLRAGDVEELEAHFVAALVELFGYHAPNPAEHDYLRRAIPAWAPHVERFVEGRSFLFEL